MTASSNGNAPQLRTGSGIEHKDIDPGRYIFREFESGDMAFIVKSGEVELFMTIDGEQVHLSTVTEGQMFGEMALIDDSPRMAAAKAKGPVKLMAISKPVFDRKIEAMDPFTRNLVGVLADYIRSTVDTFTDYMRQKSRPEPEPETED
ncbi:MAG: cyclic nucleotide-binding domain-containing protein [Magnetovibrio sp.]|nr:cyclic nucleotide-binding domain-containing protein [Magnetovibrio sp.]